MSKRSILALALVTVALLAYIVMFERSSVTSKERSERAGRVLASFVRDKVERLTIQRQGKRVVLGRKPQEDGTLAGFRVLEPFAAKADDDAVDQVLGELEWLSARRTLDAISAEDNKRFGLAAPRYRVSFEAGSETHTLAVGNGDVHGESVYVRVDDEPRAYVVPNTVLGVLDHEPGHFRDKQLFPELTVAWARKLQVEQGARHSQFDKTGEHWWLADEPRGYADQKRIDELLHALAELRAARYLEAPEQPAAASALVKPLARIDVDVVPDETREDKKPKALVLELGGACAGHAGERYARTSIRGAAGHLVCVAEADLKPFELGSEALREPRLVRADVAEIESFTLALGKDKLTLSRDKADWKAQSGSAAERVGAIDREAVEAWLSELAAARTLGFGARSDFEERGSLTLELGDDKRERIAFGALSSDNELPVVRGDEPLVTRFPVAVFDRLQPTPGRFAALEVWAAHQPSEVVRVESQTANHARTSVLSAGQWQGADAGPPLDTDRVRELVRTLIDLRARSFASDHGQAWHGLSRPSAHVKLTLQDDKALTLALGAPTDRGAYAQVDGRAIVEVGSEVMAAITELSGGPRAPTAALDEEDEEPEGEHGHGHAH